MSKKLYILGVGPGSAFFLTDIAKEIVKKSNYIIGYRYTLAVIRHLIDFDNQNVFEVNMRNQDSTYLKVFTQMKENEICLVPFTGDANFSESEVVDRLLEIFGDSTEIIPGISSIQVAASKSKVPLDKSKVITFHVTGDIEEKKKELLDAIRNRKSVILLPRPWPSDKNKHFMQSEIAIFLLENGVDTTSLKVWVFENLTNTNESIFKGTVKELENREFSDLSVMVIDQARRQTYLEF